MKKFEKEEIKSFLQLGKGSAIGGSPMGLNNFVAIENIFNSVQKYGRENKISKKNLEKIHAHTILTGLDLEKTFTSDPRAHKLLAFLRENKHLVPLNVDKSPSVCFIDQTDDHKKLNRVFDEN